MAKTKVVETETPRREVQITPPKLQTAEFLLIGTSPYVQQAFSQKAREQIKGIQEAGSQRKKGKNYVRPWIDKVGPSKTRQAGHGVTALGLVRSDLAGRSKAGETGRSKSRRGEVSHSRHDSDVKERHGRERLGNSWQAGVG